MLDISQCWHHLDLGQQFYMCSVHLCLVWCCFTPSQCSLSIRGLHYCWNMHATVESQHVAVKSCVTGNGAKLPFAHNGLTLVALQQSDNHSTHSISSCIHWWLMFIHLSFRSGDPTLVNVQWLVGSGHPIPGQQGTINHWLPMAMCYMLSREWVHTTGDIWACLHWSAIIPLWPVTDGCINRWDHPTMVTNVMKIIIVICTTTIISTWWNTNIDQQARGTHRVPEKVLQ